MSIKEKISNIERDDGEDADTLEMLQEALGITKIEWYQILDATSVSECEALLSKYLGLDT